MTLKVLSLDEITNHGATTNAEYAMLMLRWSQRARDASGRTAMINVSVRDEQGFESYHTPDGELTVRDGTQWVSIICGGISAGRVGEWLLVRGSPPPENPKYVLHPERVAEAEAVFTRLRTSKRSPDDDIAAAAKRQAAPDETKNNTGTPVSTTMVNQGTSMATEQAAKHTADAETQTELRATRTVMTLQQLSQLRRERNINSSLTQPNDTGNQPAADQQKLHFSPVYPAAETKPLLLSRLTYSKAKLLEDAATLAQKIGDGLAEICRLNEKIERRRRTIQGLWRVNGQLDNHYVKRFTGEVEQLVPQRDALLNQTKVWADEKRELDRKIAELVEVSVPLTRK